MDWNNGNEFFAFLGTLSRFVLHNHSTCLQSRVDRRVIDFMSTSKSSPGHTASPFPLPLPVRGTSLHGINNHFLQISPSLYFAGIFSTTVASTLSSCFLHINTTSRSDFRGRGFGTLGFLAFACFRYSRIRSLASFFRLVSNYELS